MEQEILITEKAKTCGQCRSHYVKYDECSGDIIMTICPEATDADGYPLSYMGVPSDPRPEWCPRNQMPEYYESRTGTEFGEGYAAGWNAFLEYLKTGINSTDDDYDK